METKENKASSEGDKPEDEDCFSQVTAVVTDWMLDFLFVSLCRNFKDGNLEEFDKNMSSFEALVADDQQQSEKELVCAFLGRVMHGKELDVSFEEDRKVMPLMSAAKIWSELKEHVEDGLAKNMTVLLCVQSVTLCLENGSNALFIIEWFEKNLDLPSALRVKLRTVVAQKDNYHPLIMSFSYSRLLENTQAFLDAFLQKNPCDYLLQAATKAVQSSGKRGTLKNNGPKDDIQTSMESTAVNKVNKENEEKTLCFRSKRKLLSTNIPDLWAPQSCKKSIVCLMRISKKELPKYDAMNTTQTKKWTWEKDRQLIAGVKSRGLGQWSRILQDFDFGGRTGTMLKDRWRTLQKSQKV